MKKRLHITIRRSHPAAVTACCLMALSAAIRLWHFLAGELTPFDLWVQLVLPTAAAVIFLAGFAVDRIKTASLISVVLGVAFFIAKATTFAPLHQALCTVLYCAVLVLYSLTVLGYLPTKKLMYPLFGLPLLYHIFVEDTQAYFFAQPPVPVWEWMPEISVLCIMAGLLSLSFAMNTKQL